VNDAVAERPELLERVRNDRSLIGKLIDESRALMNR